MAREPSLFWDVCYHTLCELIASNSFWNITVAFLTPYIPLPDEPFMYVVKERRATDFKAPKL